jgi:hypothetical protein
MESIELRGVDMKSLKKATMGVKVSNQGGADQKIIALPQMQYIAYRAFVEKTNHGIQWIILMIEVSMHEHPIPIGKFFKEELGFSVNRLSIETLPKCIRNSITIERQRRDDGCLEWIAKRNDSMMLADQSSPMGRVVYKLYESLNELCKKRGSRVNVLSLLVLMTVEVNKMFCSSEIGKYIYSVDRGKVSSQVTRVIGKLNASGVLRSVKDGGYKKAPHIIEQF